MRYYAAQMYITNLLQHNDWGKGKASQEAANAIYQEKSISSSHSYRSRMIRRWAEEFASNGSIKVSIQGKHSKRLSILADEDVMTRYVY
jgi:peptidyl-tRNA hydrolase